MHSKAGKQARKNMKPPPPLLSVSQIQAPPTPKEKGEENPGSSPDLEQVKYLS